MKLKAVTFTVTALFALMVATSCQDSIPELNEMGGGGSGGGNNTTGGDNQNTSGGGSTGPTFDPTLQAAALTIIANNCNSCHNSGNAQDNISCLTGNASDVATMVSSGLVIPGQPTNSTLYQAMTSSTNPMPTTGLLPSSDAQAISAWIASGTTGH